MAAIAFAAMSVYRGDAQGPFSAAFVTPAGDFASDVRLACPPAEAVPMEADQVPVRVLNATDTAGLASNVSNTLAGRGFVPVGTGNWSREYLGTARIMFGTKGLVQAYTVANHIEGAELVLDTRTNGTVDVVVGEAFTPGAVRPLLAPELQPEQKLTATAQCLPADLVRAEPAPRTIPEDPFATEDATSPEPEGDDADDAPAEDSDVDPDAPTD